MKYNEKHGMRYFKDSQELIKKLKTAQDRIQYICQYLNFYGDLEVLENDTDLERAEVTSDLFLVQSLIRTIALEIKAADKDHSSKDEE